MLYHIILFQQIKEAGGAQDAEVLSGQWSKEIRAGTKNLYLSFYKEEVTSKDRNGKYFIFYILSWA